MEEDRDRRSHRRSDARSRDSRAGRLGKHDRRVTVTHRRWLPVRRPSIRPVVALARGAIHGQWVTGKVGSTTFTTHDEIRGQVSAVSPTSITVKAIDNVEPDLRHQLRHQGAGADGRQGCGRVDRSVKSGEHVVVRGTGTGTLTATGVLVVTK